MIRHGKDSVPSNFVSCSDELIYDVRGNEARGAGDLPNTTVSTMRRLARGICQFTRMKDISSDVKCYMKSECKEVFRRQWQLSRCGVWRLSAGKMPAYLYS